MKFHTYNVIDIVCKQRKFYADLRSRNQTAATYTFSTELGRPSLYANLHLHCWLWNTYLIK